MIAKLPQVMVVTPLGEESRAFLFS